MDVIFMAIAVGMDALSMNIGIGTRQLPLRTILKLSFAIGVAHILSPLFGMLCAQALSRYVSTFATILGGGLLIFMGVHMSISALFSNKKDVPSITLHGISVLIVAFSVSVDAMSIGFTLGLFSANAWFTIFLFGFCGMMMSAIGLFVGRHVGYWLGSYGEFIGGIILFSIGCKILF